MAQEPLIPENITQLWNDLTIKKQPIRVFNIGQVSERTRYLNKNH